MTEKELEGQITKYTKWIANTFFGHRRNFYAKYKSTGSPQCWRDLISAPLLEDHLAGRTTIGAYSTDDDDMCIWQGSDIDAHEDVVPEGNEPFAFHLYHRLKALGFSPILEDSNGRGGFHNWILFDEKIPAHVMRSFGKWLTKDHEEFKIGPPEVFPKQVSIRGKVGNQMRLPGRHHKRDHWSRIWNGSEWLPLRFAGLDYMMSLPKATASMIPAEAATYLPPEPERTNHTPPGWDEYDPVDWPKNYDGDLKTLDIVKLFEDQGMYRSPDGDGHIVVCPWASEHSTDSTGTKVWKEDGKYPGFNCMHATCENAGRSLEDVLAWFGKDAVDGCCEKMFGHADDIELRNAETEAEKVVGQGRIPDPPPPPEKAEETAQETHQDPPTTKTDDGTKYQNWTNTAESGKTTKTKNERKRPGYLLRDLAKRPRLSWTVEKHIPADSINMVFGKSGRKKTFFCLDMGLCVSQGIPFQDFKTIKGPVCYILGEGSEGFFSRSEAWCHHHGIDHETIENFCVIPSIFNLMRLEEANELIATATETLGAFPVLWIIDTLSRQCEGDTDKNADMKVYLRVLDHIRETGKARGTPTAAVSIHHTGWEATDRPVGASSLMNYCDSIIEIAGDVDVSQFKVKEGEPFPKRRLAVRKVADSIVLETTGIQGDVVTGQKKADLAADIVAFRNAIPATGRIKRIDLRKSLTMSDDRFEAAMDAIQKHPDGMCWGQDNGERGCPWYWWRKS